MSEIDTQEQTEAEALEAASQAPDEDVVTAEGTVENPSDPSDSSTPTETVEEAASPTDLREFLEDFYTSHDAEGRLVRSVTRDEAVDTVVRILASRVAELDADTARLSGLKDGNRAQMAANNFAVQVLSQVAVQVSRIPNQVVITIDEESEE